MFSFFKSKETFIWDENKNAKNLRHTVKALPIFDHKRLWKTVVLSKENHNQKWSLLWWWIEKGEDYLKALQRELNEEIWNDVIITRKKSLWLLDTQKQRHKIFVVKLSWKVEVDPKELETLWFYPLEQSYEKERKALEKNMDFHAKKALRYFISDHHPETYLWSDIKIPHYVFDYFKDEIKRILSN